MGGYLYTSAIVFSIGAIAGVLYREVVRWWEGPLWEVPLYTFGYFKSDPLPVMDTLYMSPLSYFVLYLAAPVVEVRFRLGSPLTPFAVALS